MSLEEMLKDQIEVKAPNCPECGRRLQWNGSAFKHGAGSASCSVRDGKFDAEGEIVEEQKPLSKDAVILPRNDFVIIRKVQLGKTETGISLPDSAIEGIEFIVHAKGPKVEQLKLGDRVLIIGTAGQDYGYLPRSKELFITKESNVVLVFGGKK